MKKLFLFSSTACFFLFAHAQNLPNKGLIKQNSSSKKQSSQKYLTEPSLLLKKSNLKKIQGCLDAPEGEYPFTEFDPECMGERETITENGKFGEYSMVKIISKGAKYTFSTDVPTAVITIANAEGDTVLTSGVGSVTWTSTYAGKIRFITHIDAECTPSNGNVAKYIQCGESTVVITEPNFPCFMGDGLLSNNFENGLRIGDGDYFYIADDFDVQVGIEFNVKQIRLNVISELPIETVKFLFKENATNKPGNTLHDISLTPSFTRKIGTTPAPQEFTVYELTFDLDNPLKFNPGKYWMIPLVSSVGFTDFIYWETTSLGKNGDAPWVSEDLGETWTTSTIGQQVFFISGECLTLSTSDINHSDISIYPNPVHDFLNIKTQKEIQSVTVYDLSGRQVMKKIKVENNQINTSSLSKGTYMLQIELKGKPKEILKFIKK